MSKPICHIDTETTSVEVDSAKIVQICIIKMDTLGQVLDKRTKLINPGIPIPAEATAVHGITDEMVKDAPTFQSLSKGIFDFIEGCDFAGYNIINFDVPLLAEEFARCNITWPPQDALFFDAMKIFHEKEKRDLTAAMKFYCGVELEGAHDAENDVLASAKVLAAQLTKYEDLKAMTPEQLSKFCMPQDRLDLAGKIVLKDGEAVYNFGKDKGKSVKKFPGFGEWMLKNSFTSNTKNVVRSLIYSK